MPPDRKNQYTPWTIDPRGRQARRRSRSPTTGRRRNPWGTNNPEDFNSENWPSEIEFAGDFEDEKMDDSTMGTGSAGEQHKRSGSPENDEKPSKKQSLRMPPYPDDLQGARPADRMLWVWKLEGKSWFAIQQEYKNLCGEDWAESTMSSRFSGMMDHFAKNPAASVMIKLFRYKLAADKQLESQLWQIVARQFEENEGEKISVRAMRKAYQNIPPMGYDPKKDTKYYDPFKNIKLEDLQEEADQGGLANISKEEMALLSGQTAAPGGSLVDYASDSD